MQVTHYSLQFLLRSTLPSPSNCNISLIHSAGETVSLLPLHSRWWNHISLPCLITVATCYASWFLPSSVVGLCQHRQHSLTPDIHPHIIDLILVLWFPKYCQHTNFWFVPRDASVKPPICIWVPPAHPLQPKCSCQSIGLGSFDLKLQSMLTIKKILS